LKLRFTKRAGRQIEEIIGAIARESPQGARRVRERMQSITTLLIEHPHIGQQTDVAGIRRVLVSPYPYLIFYRVTEDAVIVQRVRHAARNPSSAPRLA
jgi:plasmid stabilization system protein ParE